MAEKIKKLEVKTLEFEAGETSPIEVDLGDKTYIAYCPNDFEFATIAKQATMISRDPMGFDFESFIGAFFQEADAYEIARRLRGKPPEINLFKEIIPTLLALIEHYEPDVEARMKQVQEVVKAQKKG